MGKMVGLYRASPRPNWNQNPPHCQVEVKLNETAIGTDTMRLVFATTLTVDVSANDDELRYAFMQLVTQSARTIYGPAAMLAKSRPTIKITETTRDGMREIPLFETEDEDA